MEIGAVRNLARTMLKASGASNNYWPLAIRCASETRFRQQLTEMGLVVPRVLPFGLRAMARQKPWHRTSAWEAPNIPVRLWGPASDLSLTSGGYYAEKSDGKCIRTTAIIVPKWKHQACQVLHSEPPQLLNPDEPAGVGPGLFIEENARGEEDVLEPQAQPKDFGLTLEDLQHQAQPKDFGLTLEDLQQDGPPLEIVQEVEVLAEDPATSLCFECWGGVCSGRVGGHGPMDVVPTQQLESISSRVGG